MWNHGNVNVELVHTGPGVRVEKFRSEGTGFKSIRDVHWREEEVITFWVKGEDPLDMLEHKNYMVQDEKVIYRFYGSIVNLR